MLSYSQNFESMKEFIHNMLCIVWSVYTSKIWSAYIPTSLKHDTYHGPFRRPLGSPTSDGEYHLCKIGVTISFVPPRIVTKSNWQAIGSKDYV
jgi:hypothetical protein